MKILWLFVGGYVRYKFSVGIPKEALGEALGG